MDQSTFSEHVLQEWLARADETLGAVMRHVYLWMFVGLFTTAAVSLALIYTPLISLFIYILENPLLFYGLLIGELILVMFLRSRVFSLPVMAAQAIFILYAILNGVTLSVIFFGLC